MPHDHSSRPGVTAGHAHTADVKGRAFAIGIVANLTFVAIEATYGVLSHSMALIADAGHNLSDVLSLGLSWGAVALAKAKPTRRRTYGLRGTTMLASFANAVALLVVAGAIGWESIRRLLHPEPVAGKTVMIVAAIGIVVNAGSALPFLGSSRKDVNVRSALLHLASDAAVSTGVVIAGGLMIVTGWRWLDPAVSIALSLIILGATWSLLRHSLDLVLAAVPPEIDPEAVRAHLAALPGVEAVHDLHIWALSTTETALTAHLVMKWPDCAPEFLGRLPHELHEKFDIDHTTVQLEPDDAADVCKQAADHAL